MSPIRWLEAQVGVRGNGGTSVMRTFPAQADLHVEPKLDSA